MATTKYKARKFVADEFRGTVCPICGKQQGSIAHTTFYGPEIHMLFRCTGCNHRYTNIFRYAGFEPHEDVVEE